MYMYCSSAGWCAGAAGGQRDEHANIKVVMTNNNNNHHHHHNHNVKNNSIVIVIAWVCRR